MNIPFVKMHANGNDFVIIDNRTKSLLFSKSKILLLSNRNTGIGFDQLILLEKSKSNDIFMKIYNSNGKEAKMCGNAATCVASLLFASKDSNSISIETISSKINAKLSKSGSVNTTIELPSQNFLNIVRDEKISSACSALDNGLLCIGSKCYNGRRNRREGAEKVKRV